MSIPETVKEKDVNKVLFAIRQGVYSPGFAKSLISYVSCDKNYDVEYYVSSPGEYEQDTLKLYSEKMEKGSVVVFISPSTGFSPESIEKVVQMTTPSKIYGLAVPISVSTFSGSNLIQTMEHARIMAGTFELSAKGGSVELDKDASILVSDFQRNDIICIPHEIASTGIEISKGYKNLCDKITCRLLSQFPVSYNGLNGCLLEQLRHIVYMRGMAVQN